MLTNMRWKSLFIALIVGCAIWSLFPHGKDPKTGEAINPINLGLDLRGGMHVVLEVDTKELPKDAQAGARERALEIIRKRVDEFGVSEPVIIPEGENRIVVQLPGITDRERARKLIGKTALLEFKLVSTDQEQIKNATEGNPPPEYSLAYMPSERGGIQSYKIPILVKNKAELTGAYLADAQPEYGSAFNEPEISITFNPEGGKIFALVTERYVGRQLAILLDGEVLMAPVIKTVIPNGRGVITGNFTMEEVRDTALLLRAGALPAPVKFIEDRTVSATLGRDSIRQGVYAAVAGLITVMVFMVIYYHLGGVIATFALILNLIILMGAMAWFKFTLTLPGIAGIILTMGMAVDANVLIFERMREEQTLGKKIRTVIENGYDRAFLAIFDSNLTTLLSGIILFMFGTGPVKGYAVTLSIGIATSMFTALVVTRNVFDYLSLNKKFTKLTMMKMIGVPKIDFMSKGFIAMSISAIIIVVGAIAFIHQGKKNFGIDFLGGSLIELGFKEDVKVDEVRKALDEVGLGASTIQQTSDKNVIIKTGANVEDKIKTQITKKFPDNTYEVLKTEEVGPVIGKDLQRKAIIAVLLSLVGIMVYLGFRFDVSYGVGALLSLFHDVLITMAFLALTGRELSLNIVAALLTIIGYSVNDTIVIFDRVRENLKYMRKTDLKTVFNVSLNQTLSRTLLTSLTVLFVVVGLYLFGGEVINDFAFALVIGTIAGSYSTVFIAAPLVLWWRGNQKV